MNRLSRHLLRMMVITLHFNHAAGHKANLLVLAIDKKRYVLGHASSQRCQVLRLLTFTLNIRDVEAHSQMTTLKSVRA